MKKLLKMVAVIAGVLVVWQIIKIAVVVGVIAFM